MTGNSDDETNFSFRLLLTDIQFSKICKAFANGSSVNNINVSKTQWSKMIQSGGFLTDIFRITSNITSGLNNFVNFSFKAMKSYSNKISNINNKKK